MKTRVSVRGRGKRPSVLVILGWSLTALAITCCSSGRYEPLRKSAHIAGPPEVQSDLKRTVYHLAGDIGERNAYHAESLNEAKSWILEEMQKRGLQRVQALPFKIDGAKYECREQMGYNLEGEVRGTERPEDIIVIGAHYDTKVHTPHWKQHDHMQPHLPGTPGANDNASGVATVLSLAKYFSAHPQPRTLRFVAFTNEEAPFYQQPDAMGSMVYARLCKEERSNEKVILMITPETLGCYSAKPAEDHQKRRTTEPLSTLVGLADRPDYVAFMGNMRTNKLMRGCASAFQAKSTMTVRTFAVRELAKSVAWSDDWSFWQFDIPAFAVTDTAYNRYDSYHDVRDKPETLDYPAFAEVVAGLRSVVTHAATVGK
jgi:Peptidase family M28